MTTTELLNASDVYAADRTAALHRPAGYQLRLAANQTDVLAVQRLRYEVFEQEGGASTPGPDGLDQDALDDSCDHLIVWHRFANGPAQAVATYRLLPPHGNEALPRRCGLYADREFGLAPLEPLLDSTVEAGRACVRADHRGGTAIGLLWTGIARYLHLTGYRYLLGCASVDLGDGGTTAASIWDLALRGHLAPAGRRCRARNPLPIGGIERAAGPVTVPPLLRGYLRLGAKVCGPPAHDPEFAVADFLVLLDLTTANQRYLRRFLP